MRILILSICILTFVWPQAQAQNQIETQEYVPSLAEIFARDPAVLHPTLSPSGDQVAFLHSSQSHQSLIIQSIISGERHIFNVDEFKPGHIIWIDEDHLLFSLGVERRIRQVGLYLDQRMQSYGIIDLSQTEPQAQALFPRAATNSRFQDIDILGFDSVNHEIILSGNLQRYANSSSLIALNINTLETRTVSETDTDITRWWINSNHQGVARLRTTQFGRVNTLEIQREGQWQSLQSWTTSLDEIILFNLTQDETGLVIFRPSSSTNNDQFEVLNLTTGMITPLEGPSTHGLASQIFTEHLSQKTIGYDWNDTVTHTHWFDPTLRAVQSQLETQFPDLNIRLASWNAAKTRIIALVDGPLTVPTYLLYDQESANLTPFLSSQYPEVRALGLSPRQAVHFNNRDGVSIETYLTLPQGQTPQPFIVLLHGGPHDRDYPGYDRLAHFLAAQGYGVAQPNFQGSIGYGRNFLNAGYGEWGQGRMQHDVEDVTLALIENGLADPSRICIMGASYGGYSALSGAMTRPDLYACAVGINGLYDLQDAMRAIHRRGDDDDPYVQYWQRSMGGDPSTRPTNDYLRARSPRHNARTLTAPILLIYGGEDWIVNHEQSENMYRALSANRQVERLYLRDADHVISDVEERTLTFETLQTFLSTHLPIR